MSHISEQRREQIVLTARTIVDERGPAHLTAESITREVGVSRPLLYHYFANMGDLLEAVIGLYVDEFEQRLAAWEEACDASLAADRAAWSASLAQLLREVLVGTCPLLQGFDPAATPCAYPLFLNRCAAVLAVHVSERNVDAWAPCRDAEHPREAAHFAVMGLAGTLVAFPDASIETAARLLERTMAAAYPAEDGAAKPVPASGGKDSGGEENTRKGLFGWIFNS